MIVPPLPPDAPYTAEELAEAEALRDALHAYRTDSEDATLLHELRALRTDAELSVAEHEALVAAALEQAGADVEHPAKPVLRLLRRVSYAAVPTLAAAATVMFVIRGRDAAAPAAPASAMSESASAIVAAAPTVEAKTDVAAQDLAAKREESEKVRPLAPQEDPNAPTAPWGQPLPNLKSADKNAEYAMPPPASIDEAVPGGGALGTGSASGAGATAGHVYAESARARKGAAATATATGSADNARGDNAFKDDGFGRSLGSVSADKKASEAKPAPLPAPAQAPKAQASAQAAMEPASKRAARAPAARSSNSDVQRDPNTMPTPPPAVKLEMSPTCKLRCAELLEARKRLDASCTQPNVSSKVCADQKAWLTQQLEQHAQACGVCR